ncbi:MAG TPA: pitrilysin family protein [Verrucomicrobiae bacterium]|nr:pitrilysin family protein [Verrucomicrobiae bacterium]
MIQPKLTGPTAGASALELPAIPADVRVVTLENGLTIIVREDHSAPVVSAQAWCKSGSIHEGQWLGAGLSHVLEHMLFKGTTTRPGSRIDQEVQEAGGYMNAYTSFDRTVYWINVPNTGARVAIDILCDIMRNATLPEEELIKELDVIRREMDMNQDDPHRRASRRLFETAYTRSPYRLTIIGYPDIFNELKRADIHSYYQGRYVPNNVFYVVTGDVMADEVVGQIKEAYAKTKARSLPPMVLPAEPRQTAPREVIEEAPIELGHVHLSWHIPELGHPDVPLLDVLAVILGSGRSSRFYQVIREQKGLAHSVDAWTYSPGSPGLFGSSALVDADKFTAARDAILAEVERIKNELVSPAELAKAVKQFISGTLSSRKTMQGQAQDLGGSWLVANDLSFSERYLALARQATAGELQRVARQYLTTCNRTLYALLPAGTAPQEVAHVETSTDQAVQLFTLPNGLRLLVKEDHRLPFVEFRMLFRGGVLSESEENNGATSLMTRLLLKGTATRTAEQIAAEIESVGGSMDTYGGNNSFGVQAEVMREDFDIGLNLMADVILNPSFPEAALEREREEQLAGIKAQRDQLLQSASRAMKRALFGATGYGLDTLGAEASVERLQVEDLRKLHRELATPNNCVLAIYGDVQTAVVRARVEQALGKWAPGGALPASLASGAVATGPAKGPRRVIETRDKKQAVLVAGFPGTTIDDSDRYALELLQEACSDLGSRLFLRIRDQLGLAYYVGAQNFLGLAPGFFAFYAGTAGDKAPQVEAEILKEAGTLRAEGLTEAELRRAKAKVIGQRKIARQELGGLAMSTALDELYGLGYAQADREDAAYEAVTLEQVKAVARKYLDPQRCVVAIVQPAEAGN